MKQLIEFVVKALVDNPDKVDVREITGEKTVIYELRVGSGDLGKVIGKEGRT
ncbi:MAG TPA: KH domain-containing protein, partial [bacterium (Candidatus Stahlbacteria)]|nr:KH domain-containing protein [Candidatus Stahlbacteria bacterium]